MNMKQIIKGAAPLQGRKRIISRAYFLIRDFFNGA